MQNAAEMGRGGVSIAQNGLTWQNGLQVVGGGLGMAGDFADVLPAMQRGAGGVPAAPGARPSGFEPHGTTPLPGTRVRPEGIPDGWRVRPTSTKGGVEYYNPKNPNEHVRVMQGNPNSPYPNSQKPYVRQRDSSGSYLDANGNRVPKKSPDGHIPLDQYPGFIQ